MCSLIVFQENPFKEITYTAAAAASNKGLQKFCCV